MEPNEVISALKLQSNDNFGIFDHSYADQTDIWESEEKSRNEYFENLPDFIPKFSDSIKKEIRLGIPSIHRRKLWFQETGGFKLYQELGTSFDWEAVKAKGNARPNTGTDFGSTIDIANFLPDSEKAELVNFLHIIWVTNPQIICSPMIPTIATILLMYMEPPLAYLSLQAMINASRDDQHWYFTLDEKSFVASGEAIQEQVNRVIPEVYRKSLELGVSLSQFVVSLFPAFFLPFSTLPVALMFFDSFALEGRKVLLRFCIGLMLQERTKLLTSTSSSDFQQVILNAIRNITNPAKAKKLIRDSFNIFLSRKHMRTSENRALSSPSNGMSRSPMRPGTFSGRLPNLMMFSGMMAFPGPLTIGGLPPLPSTPKEQRKKPSHINPSSSSNSVLKHTPGVSSLPIDQTSPLVGEIDPECLSSSSSIGFEDSGSFSSTTLPAPPSSIEAAEATNAILMQHLPTVEGGKLLTNFLFYRMREYLPPGQRYYSPYLVYQLSYDGASLSTLYSKTNKKYSYILLVKTKNSTFGIFLDKAPNIGVEGTARTFVFSADTGKFYRVKKQNNLYYSCSRENFQSGFPKPALFFDSYMKIIFSAECETFDSPSLFTTDKESEKILDIEMYELRLKR